PESMLQYCHQHDIEPLIYGKDFTIELDQSKRRFEWRSKKRVFESLPLPFGQHGHQLKNAATAVQAVLSLESTLPVSELAISTGIAQARAPARCQLLATNPCVVLDVAHNVDSVAGLLEFLTDLNIRGQVYAVCGMLADKQIAETLAQLTCTVDEWHFASIDHPRGASAEQIDNILRDYLSDPAGGGGTGTTKSDFQSFHHDSARDACRVVQRKLKNDDCLVVFGSFFIASDIIDLI
ncbi:MAG: hypothetical protein HKN85_03435, partial [Gammaproteobacteria bacterium]|nr:hypothetical protein [Gammaproteobacteria bacterium]